MTHLAPIPKNDGARVRAVQRYIRVTAPGQWPYIDVVDLACALTEAPIAGVSLISAQQQIFKSQRGMQASEYERRLTLCAHTILRTKPLIIPDLAQDRRFYDHPMVTRSPGIKAYAGFPLLTTAGEAVGTLVVMHFQPTWLLPRSIKQLSLLAAVTLDLLELEAAGQESE